MSLKKVHNQCETYFEDESYTCTRYTVFFEIKLPINLGYIPLNILPLKCPNHLVSLNQIHHVNIHLCEINNLSVLNEDIKFPSAQNDTALQLKYPSLQFGPLFKTTSPGKTLKIT